MQRNFWLILGVALLGCADDGTDEPDAPDAQDAQQSTEVADAAVPMSDFEKQAALGATVYTQKCASCHGRQGEGGEGPRLVGLAEGALPLEPRASSQRTTKFVTVADVATFAVANMPPNKPGSLSADEYWAILAFDLSANGVKLEQKLTPELAATLTIPR